MNRFFEKKLNSFRKRVSPLARFWLSRKINQVVIEQKGGLASQLGLYMFGEYLRTYCGKNVFYDLSWFKTDGMDILGKNSRKWELENCFELEIPIADPNITETLKKWARLKAKNQFVFDETPERTPPPFYWESEMSAVEYKIKMAIFFQNLKFKANVLAGTREDAEEIGRWGNSVSVHVRRGDFVGSIHDICGIDYYKRAFDILFQKLKNKNGIKFFVFSNGFDWVKEYLLPLIPSEIPVQLMEKNDNDHMHGDFFLMSHCKHQIVPNSGFSTFATLLKPVEDRIVIEPDEVVLGVKNKPFPGHIYVPIR